MLLFHTTDQADAILRDGFRDGTGGYGFIGHTLTGVFLSVWPADVNDGAKGSRVLQVTLPDDVDLAPWSIEEDDVEPWEWCVPAEVLNGQCQLRLLTEEEEDDLAMRRWRHREDVEHLTTGEPPGPPRVLPE